MKSTFLLFLALTLNGFVFGQYNLTTTMEPYQSLSNPTPLHSAPWNKDSSFPIYFNFNFSVGSQTFTSVNVMAGGGLSFPGQGNIQLRVFGHPDSGYLLEDRDQSNSASPIGYEVAIGDVGLILKIQWKNAGFREWCESSSLNDHVDFQIWLYEHTNKIEVHFGDHVADAGAYGQPDCNSGTDGTQFIFEYDDCNNALSLTGNANLPSYDFRNHCIWQPAIHVSGTPSSGIVYNLSNPELTTNEIEKNNIKVYPIPTASKLMIEHDNLEINKMEIIDLTGKTVKTFEQYSGSIDVSDLSEGIYFINLSLDDAIVTKRFVKQ